MHLRLLVLLVGLNVTASAEWWGFRGPGGNGVSTLSTLPATWSAQQNVAWKTAIPGRGHSSPIIVGGRVFLTTSIEGDPIPGKKAVPHKIDGKEFIHPQTAAEDRKVTLKALAVDTGSGRIAWERTVYEGPVYDGRHQFNTYASPTALTDGTSVFFYFEAQGLYAFDFDGNPLWKMSIGGVAKMGLGAGTSPVLAGGHIVLVADEDEGEKSFIYGLSPKNGEIVWKTKRTTSVTWNTPVVAQHKGREIVVSAATQNVIAYDPKNGKELWRGPGIEGYGAASPVSAHGLVFPHAYHPVKRLFGMRLDPEAAERVVWRYDKGTAYVPSPIAYGGYLYLITDAGLLTCLEALTGKVIYEGKRLPKPAKVTASPVAFDGKLFLTSADGDTHVIRAGPEHEVLGTNSVGEPVYASPALDGDSIYIRGANNLYRIRSTKIVGQAVPPVRTGQRPVPHLPAATKPTALDRYVHAKDAVYGWKLVRTIPGDGVRGYVLELTSQTWRSEAEVDRPMWKHWLTITKPDKIAANKALLFIGGGSNRDPAPGKIPERSLRIATETQTVVADLGMVPNQPLFFSDSKEKGRSEDDLIAYTRVKHFSTKDDTWLVRLAMVKSGVRAMDAIQEFLASEEGGKVKIDRFVAAGGSKRGWTTWLVGATDPRVMAIMPMVIDALNSEAITKHHYEAYGFFSPSLKDYVNHGLFPHKVGTPEYRAVLSIEDPYEYRQRPQLKMPKFLINASGDEFFLPDNSQFYYQDLPEEKHLRYVANAKHNLAGSDAVDSMIAFYQAVISSRPRPRFNWKKEKDGSLTVKVIDRPTEVNLWKATNSNARDFRLDVIGKAYSATPLVERSKGVYVASVETPASGSTAFFVELTYANGTRFPFKFTTEVSIAPDTLGFRFEDAAKKYSGTGK